MRQKPWRENHYVERPRVTLARKQAAGPTQPIRLAQIWELLHAHHTCNFVAACCVVLCSLCSHLLLSASRSGASLCPVKLGTSTQDEPSSLLSGAGGWVVLLQSSWVVCRRPSEQNIASKFLISSRNTPAKPAEIRRACTATPSVYFLGMRVVCSLLFPQRGRYGCARCCNTPEIALIVTRVADRSLV